MSMDFENEYYREKAILVTNIQRFSLHDGPGIRTTVFLKGCSIYCPWCSNPENLIHLQQQYKKRDKNGMIEEEGVYGKWYSCDELYAELMKDRAFYCSRFSDMNDLDEPTSYLNSLPGGVTFSGGECMLQMRDMEPLLQRLDAENIHMAVETSLFCSADQLSIAIAYIDLFYLDIKILDREVCRYVLGGSIDTFRKNLRSVLQSGKPIIFRLPVIGGFTDCEKNRAKALELITDTVHKYKNVLKIEILKEHNLGMNKYQSLLDGGNEIRIPEYKGVSDELVNQYRKEILHAVDGALPVEICKI
ncbi:radical SAM protein [Enterocloster clostridioformis]|uniref:Radical SAM core domain-containing protein n=1 Tax=[Clostridium] clostridioforme 90A8 TaxID=999408 RepID=A0A0E2H988_9FIRM|nr:hypothetical protein HMPREF1090_02737 [[Clostridium] clostridioforme 90A8]